MSGTPSCWRRARGSRATLGTLGDQILGRLFCVSKNLSIGNMCTWKGICHSAACRSDSRILPATLRLFKGDSDLCQGSNCSETQSSASCYGSNRCYIATNVAPTKDFGFWCFTTTGVATWRLTTCGVLANFGKRQEMVSELNILGDLMIIHVMAEILGLRMYHI